MNKFVRALFYQIMLNIIVFVLLDRYNVLTLSSVIGVIIIQYIVRFIISYLYFIKPVEKLSIKIDSLDYENIDESALEEVSKIKLASIYGFHKLVEKLTDLMILIKKQNVEIHDTRYKAEHDELTGLLNRIGLERRKDRYNLYNEYAVIFFDLNNLKLMNDLHGHDDGDILLKHASEQLSLWNTYGDVYRIGGDEFLAILPQMTYAQLNPILVRWYNSLDRLNKGYTDKWDCNFAYGVKYKAKGEPAKIDDVINEADEIMYKMKQEMKNDKEVG